MRQLTHYFVGLVMVAAVVMIGVCTFWLVYPYKTIAFHNSPFPVIGPVVRGQQLNLYVEHTRFTDLPATAIARYTDGIMFTALPMTFQKHPGSYKGISCSWKVPEVLPPGKYYLDLSFSYEVNPLRTIVVQARTQEFVVN